MSSYCIVTTAIDDEVVARSLASAIVSARLAACVQVCAIQSTYRWKGEVCTSGEWLLTIKTTNELYGRLEEYIRVKHTYETPEIVQVAVAEGLPLYLARIRESTE